MEKTPVYNGYEEKYLSGLELKNSFNGEYYTSGKHHSVVMGISIKDYLTCLNIDDNKQYRIFTNEYFCRVMDSETDELIDFFSHTDLQKVKLNHHPDEITIETICPDCGSRMVVRRGRYGDFLGCSSYPSCKHTQKLIILGNNSQFP